MLLAKKQRDFSPKLGSLLLLSEKGNDISSKRRILVALKVLMAPKGTNVAPTFHSTTAAAAAAVAAAVAAVAVAAAADDDAAAAAAADDDDDVADAATIAVRLKKSVYAAKATYA